MFAGGAAVSALAIGFACSEGPSSDPSTDDGQLGPLGGDAVVGSLRYGDTSAPVAYTPVPRYRAFTFDGRAGDRVEIWVRSADGRPMAWLRSPDARTLSYDTAALHEAHVVGTLDSTGVHAIAFREANLGGATMTVTLSNLVQFEAGSDAAGDASGDAGVDSDGGPNDAGVPDGGDGGAVDGGVTCSFSRTLPVLGGCSTCVLPVATSYANANVPLLIDDAGGGVWDTSIDGGKGRTLHFQSPGPFDDFGCSQLSAIALNGAPPNETWAYPVNAPQPCAITNGGVGGSAVSVANGDQATVAIHGTHQPAVLNCGIVHGCVVEKLDCVGTATAIVK